jgi:hypothetical protein
MTGHAHDPAAQTDSRRPLRAPKDGTNPAAARPRWLLPGLLVGIAAAGLVIAGVLSLSTVLYAGLFGGMMLMHVGGHGGHGGYGGGHWSHGGHGDDPTNDAENLSARSSGPQAPRADFKGELDDRASTDRNGNETDDHDKHGSHGCH